MDKHRNIPLNVFTKGQPFEKVLEEYMRIWNDAKKCVTAPGKDNDEIFAGHNEGGSISAVPTGSRRRNEGGKQMNELIKVDYSTDRPTVSARELHEFLEVETPYHKWFPRMADYGFLEGQDFLDIFVRKYRRPSGTGCPAHH